MGMEGQGRARASEAGLGQAQRHEDDVEAELEDDPFLRGARFAAPCPRLHLDAAVARMHAWSCDLRGGAPARAHP